MASLPLHSSFFIIYLLWLSSGQPLFARTREFLPQSQPCHPYSGFWKNLPIMVPELSYITTLCQEGWGGGIKIYFYQVIPLFQEKPYRAHLIKPGTFHINSRAFWFRKIIVNLFDLPST